MKARSLLQFAFLPVLILFFFNSIDTTAQIIPESRKINWDPGTRTDLRERSIIYETLSPSGGDDYPAIQNKLDNCPDDQVVLLSEGVFRISSTIEWSKSGVTLRGSGKDKTVLMGEADFSGSYFFDISSGADLWYSQSSVNLISNGLVKGSDQIETDVPHEWSSGDFVLIDQLNDESADPRWDDYGYYGECNWCSREDGERLKGQVVRVTVIDDHTLNIDPPLYYDYNIDKLPQGTRCAGTVEGVSIESLTIDNTVSQANKTIGLFFVFNSLFYDLDIEGVAPGSGSRHMWFYGTLWNTVKHCDFHTALSDQTNNGYGIFLGLGSSANLIEDNIFHTLVLAVAFEGSNSGNVLAYNYTKNSLWYDPYPNRLMVLGHGGGSGMNLIEGNYIEGRFRSDAGFGTQNYFTVFRNRIEQQPGKTDQACTFDLEQGQLYCNVVGNVLGTSGYETDYEHENDNIDLSTRVIYRIGYEDPYDSDAPGNDPSVMATLLRHGNWDAVTNDVVWDPDISDKNLPASYYRSSKPEFFGNLEWPPIGPYVEGYAKTIPAKVRFEGGSVDVDDDISSVPVNFILLQNYPNPFNPTTTIKYRIPVYSTQYAVDSRNKTDNRDQKTESRYQNQVSSIKPSESSAHYQSVNQSIFLSNSDGFYSVSLVVYDILGKEVDILVNKLQSPGIYEVQWNASGFASGIYFYSLEAGNFYSVKKMILMK